jgi:S1-C subfamily serine protease
MRVSRAIRTVRVGIALFAAVAGGALIPRDVRGEAAARTDFAAREPWVAVDRANRSTVRVQATRMDARGAHHSSGAGVALSADGRIVTAYHVVRDYDVVRVTTSERTTYRARLVASAPSIDIALLKIDEGANLAPASLAAADRIQPGRSAIVTGNPLGAGRKIVAARLGPVRTVTWDGNRAELPSVLAPLLPGDSGGGAFDPETGELLGVTVAKSATLEDTGYIVPADRLAQALGAAASNRDVAETGAAPSRTPFAGVDRGRRIGKSTVYLRR